MKLDPQEEAIIRWWKQNDPLEQEYDYVDNVRRATKGNFEEEAVYEKKRSNGCCGFVDVELVCSDGTILLYGFNYGH